MSQNKTYFYEKNNHLLKSEFNKCYEDICYMTKEEFQDWVLGLRKFVVSIWDKYGCPPIVGSNEREIIKQFKQMKPFNVAQFSIKDDTGDQCINNTFNVGLVVNQWFPTMMKTKINTSSKGNGYSIYDKFALDECIQNCFTLMDRNIKRDSYYIFSRKVISGDPKFLLPECKTGKEWIQTFEKKKLLYKEYDYWLQSAKDTDSDYTGYFDVDSSNPDIIVLSKRELEELGDIVPEYKKYNLKDEKAFNESCYIRLFKRGVKIFPKIYISFKTSLGQYAVNFPPLIAKYLYEKYTEEIKNQSEPINIYDPSAGWGGRILGAMSVKDDRKIHYIGTDPNKDHTIEENGKVLTKYEDVARYYNRVRGALPGFSHDNTCEIFQLGSEVIQFEPEFQKYKGKIDLVFTSPPYFAKEAYSDDKEQSCHKFPQYKLWVDGFLYETLRTAVEWLRPNRYLLWNIADARFDGDLMPLEEESTKILNSLGMKYIGMEKMLLASAPGGNRVVDGKPTAKNSCLVNGVWRKFEPIFVWKKI